MSVEMNIRIDMAFIHPMLLFLWLNGFAKERGRSYKLIKLD